MRCPVCGAEAVQQAVYCHKCGQRLDVPSQPAESETDPSPAGGPADQLQQAVANARDAGDEAETELWQGGYSSKAMIGAWILCVLASLGLLILGIWMGAGATAWKFLLVGILLLWLYHMAVYAYRRLNIRYLLTNQRLIHQAGILRRVTERIEVLDIDDVSLEQGLVERFVGVGTIRVTSTDRSNPKLALRGIDNAKDVADLLDNTRRGERRRRGLHIEQI